MELKIGNGTGAEWVKKSRDCRAQRNGYRERD